MSGLIELFSEGLRSEIFSLDYTNFIRAIQAAIPEAVLLRTIQEATPKSERAGKPIEGVETGRQKLWALHEIPMIEPELKAFSGLLNFKDVICGDRASYENFISSQIERENPILSFDAFTEIGQCVKEKLTSPEDYAATVWAILCYELVDHGYWESPSKLFTEEPESFPAFYSLSPEYRALIFAVYASADLSQFAQLALPLAALEDLKLLSRKALDLYILVGIFNFSGNAASIDSRGSLSIKAYEWSFLNATRRALEKLSAPSDNSVEAVYEECLKFRGESMGIPTTTPTSIALIRIAGLANLLPTPLQGEKLREFLDILPADKKGILTTELNIPGNLGTRAIFVDHVRSIFEIPQTSLQIEFFVSREAAVAEGFIIGLLQLANAFECGRRVIPEGDARKEFFTVGWGYLARTLYRNPRASLDMHWEVLSSNSKEVDFAFRPLPEKTLSRASLIKGAALIFSGVALGIYAYTKLSASSSDTSGFECPGYSNNGGSTALL